MKKEALQYLLLSGFSVIPVGKDKKPLISSWKEYQDRFPTEEEVEKWWKDYPEANIGIVTGKISNITVVDVDIHKGASHDPFPVTYTVKTGNGGVQLYYTYTPGYTTSANAYRKYPHVDIRGDGGYVVAPPSTITPTVEGADGCYVVTRNVPFAPFPKDMLPVERKRRGKYELKEGVGSRNDDMTSTIGTMLLAAREEEFEKVWKAAKTINKGLKPPLEERELRTIFESVAGREMARRQEQVNRNNGEIEFLTTTIHKVEVPTMNLENICRVLRPMGKYRYDAFKREFQLLDNGKWRQFETADSIHEQAAISIKYPFFQKVGKDMTFDAIIKVARENEFDSAKDWIKGLKWDGVERLDTWLVNAYGVEDNEYHRAVGSNWLKGIVNRLVNPGCKFDYVVVLEGKQGIKKSTSLSALCGDWHLETTMSTESKDFFMQFSGKAVIEFSEGETLSRTEVKRMKAIITMQIDRYRPPYERTSMDFPRRCVFAMTTNQEQYLKDETGNRRWLPVKVEVDDIPLEWIRENREQLFAEAYFRLSVLNETTWEFPKEETERQQRMRQLSDPNEEQVIDWYFNALTAQDRKEGITTFMVFKQVYHNNLTPSKPLQKYEEMGIANILRDVLKLEKRRIVRNNARMTAWFHTEDSMKPEKEEVFDLLDVNF
jgi:hypothetical protein